MPTPELWPEADLRFVEKMKAAAQRFLSAMRDRAYSSVWYEIMTASGRSVIASHVAHKLVLDARRAGKSAPEDFGWAISVMLQTDWEGGRSGLFEGIRTGMEKMGLFGDGLACAVIPYTGGYVVLYATPNPPFKFPVPLMDLPEYPLDMESLLVGSGVLTLESFLREGMQFIAERDFAKAIEALQSASFLERPHLVLQQPAWQQVFNEGRRRQLALDFQLVPVARARLSHATHLFALSIPAPIPESLMTRNSVFLCHSSEDNEFCRRLAVEMHALGIRVWYDEWEIRVGDSILDKISSGLAEHDYLCVVLSPASVQSEWVRKELNTGILRGLQEKRVVVLPVLLDECNVPPLLADIRRADFRADFYLGLRDLVNRFTDPSQN